IQRATRPRGVVAEEALGHVAHGLEDGVAAADLVLGAAAAGNVLVRANHAVDAPAGIAQAGAAGDDPAPGAIAVPQAMLDLVGLVDAVDVALERLLDERLVVGMDATAPFVDPVRDLVIGVAEHRLPTRGEID